MPYTAITDEMEVKQAIEDLRDVFQKDAIEKGKYRGSPRYYHRNRGDLWGFFGSYLTRGKQKGNTGFGRGKGNPVFMSTIFVQDDKGNRYFVYSGNPRLSSSRDKNIHDRLNVHDRFMEFTGPAPWIDVEVGDKLIKMLLVASIDFGNPTDLIERIDNITTVIDSFKQGDANCPTTLDGATTEDSSKRRSSSALNTILYGPPGTGKTYATFRRCVEICDGSCPGEPDKIRARYKELVEKEKRVKFVTFHQSYGYEEFVEGLRPKTGSAKKDGKAGAGFRLVATAGVLKRIAERARGPSRPAGEAEASADARPHVLVIDEINRANVSKVMGELITLLEEDKREGAENEVAVTLPHSRDRFTLPANLYILGTMNTADRSIALLDTALRRRFEFEELAPDPGLLGDAAEATGIDLPAVLGAINERLEYLADRDHLIGHAWLMGARTKADVDRTMRRKIIPLIAEYFYDDWQKVRAVLGGADNGFVRGKRLKLRGLDDDTYASEVRNRWTVRSEFANDAYDRLISGQIRSPEQDQDSGQPPQTETGTE